MALMLGSLYHALVSANVPPEKAQKAAEEVASFEGEFKTVRADIAGVRSQLRADIADVRSELRAEVADVRSELRMLKWMTGSLILGVLLLLARSYLP